MPGPFFFILLFFRFESGLTLTLDEKIGQLFIIPACELRGEEHFEDLKKLLQQGRAGGILLKQGTAAGQRALIDKLQKLSPLPLLCIQDGEWGVAMRLSDAISFPRNLTLGAVQDLSLLYQLGQEIGRQCRLVGAHMNLAPVVDVNSNPLNPIIHMRSFGSDPLQVALRAEKVMSGIQSMGVLTCAKHFPGHGDTSVDSHVDLPFVAHNSETLEKIELFPFKWLIDAGVKSIMSAHLYVDALAEKPSLPATFSQKIISSLLQKEWGFQGLVVSDALNMRALAKNYSAGQIAVQTFLAGHDLLLYGDHIAPNIYQILRYDLPEAFEALKSACLNQEISEEEIDRRVSKILKVKQELGLFENAACLPIENLTGQINSPEAASLKKQLFEEAITLVSNDGILPLKEEYCALIERGKSPWFASAIRQSCDAPAFDLADPDLMRKVNGCSCLILVLSNRGDPSSHFQFTQREAEALETLSACPIPVIAVIFGTPYTLSKLPLFSATLVAYENEREAQEAAAEVLLGKREARGRLPVSLSGAE